MLAGALARMVTPLTVPRGTGTAVAAAALAAASLALLLAAGLALRQARTAVSPWEPSAALVTSGVYTRTRNPIYLAFLGLQAAFGLWTGWGWWIVLTPLSWYLLDQAQIRREERYLTETFGTAYTDYTRRVRRWL